jgi:hypothetical protein
MLKDQDVKSLVSRLDRHNADIKTAAHAKRREHLWRLADGSVDPAEKASRATRSKVPTKPRKSLLQSEAMAAVRKRKT